MRGRKLGPIIAGAALILASLLPAAAADTPEPSAPTGGPALHVIISDTTLTVERGPEAGAYLPLGVWISSPDGDFELRAWKADYDSPMTFEQWIDGGLTKVGLDPALLDGWSGLKDFVHIVIKNDANVTEVDMQLPLCPNQWGRQRIDDDGPLNPTYPTGWGCGANPFMLGNVMGLDQGWAAHIAEDWNWRTPFRLDDGDYTVEVTIAPTYVDLFSIPPGEATSTIEVRIKTRECEPHDWECIYYSPTPSGGTPTGTPSPAVPITTDPDPSTVPDLVSLPSWHIGIDQQGKMETLNFNANVWNKGPAPLVIEGFRDSGADYMKAYEYFTDASGEQVARAPVGGLEYDDRSGHQHWHLKQFANYALLNADQSLAVRSHKEAFCLFPTDAIDLTVDRADWVGGGGGGLETACGEPDALWVREVLQAGWGDTYNQSRPGQSFRLNGLPNGKYFIRVKANPGAKLWEADYDNNVSLRRIIIRGQAGQRRVVVPPWHGIDTERY